jgi:hypothetical protein
MKNSATRVNELIGFLINLALQRGGLARHVAATALAVFCTENC